MFRNDYVLCMHQPKAQMAHTMQPCIKTSQNSFTNTALHSAVWVCHLEIVKFLVEELKCPPDITGQHTTSRLYLRIYLSGPALSVVVHRSGVQRDQNLWSCNDRKGYSPEDQQFLSIFPNKTAAYFVITAPPSKP